MSVNQGWKLLWFPYSTWVWPCASQVEGTNTITITEHQIEMESLLREHTQRLPGANFKTFDNAILVFDQGWP